jgi:hypothetical protein
MVRGFESSKFTELAQEAELSEHIINFQVPQKWG